jgi:signal transduction histidine kinase
MPRQNRWLALFVATRLIATAAGLALLVAHEITARPHLLALIALVYGTGTILAAIRWQELQRNPLAWAFDAGAVLVLMLATDQWRSPFYLLGLTALIFPATGLPFRRALTFGGVYTACYFVVAGYTGIEWSTLDQSAQLEGFTTHLLVPMITVLALAYAALVLRSLQSERTRSERLAVEAERRRIAWELHDSAKQRVHAAHLMLSQHQRRDDVGAGDPLLDQALAELSAATTDIETSLTELRTPPEGRDLADGVRKRAAELERLGDVPIDVAGDTPQLPPAMAAHAFRVVAEAMTNAVRHAGADRITVRLDGGSGRLTAEVSDDGCGLPDEIRPGANGIRSMRARAGMLGGRLEIVSGTGDRASGNGHPGTTVRLEVPLDRVRGRWGRATRPASGSAGSPAGAER